MRLIALALLAAAAAAAAAPLRVSLRKLPLVPAEHRRHHANRTALLTQQREGGEANQGADIPMCGALCWNQEQAGAAGAGAARHAGR